MTIQSMVKEFQDQAFLVSALNSAMMSRGLPPISFEDAEVIKLASKAVDIVSYVQALEESLANVMSVADSVAEGGDYLTAEKLVLAVKPAVDKLQTR